MDMVPGSVTYYWFTPTKTGEFEILCAEYCGTGHYAMRGRLRVDEEKEYLGIGRRYIIEARHMNRRGGKSFKDIVKGNSN